MSSKVPYFSFHAGVLLWGLRMFVQGRDFPTGARIIIAGAGVFLVGCVLNLRVISPVSEFYGTEILPLVY